MLADGSATLTIRYLHITNKGESISGIGTGTQMTANQRGIARVTGEGTMWTSSPRLSHRMVVDGRLTVRLILLKRPLMSVVTLVSQTYKNYLTL
jgi:hypothetical protein